MYHPLAHHTCYRSHEMSWPPDVTNRGLGPRLGEWFLYRGGKGLGLGYTFMVRSNASWIMVTWDPHPVDRQSDRHARLKRFPSATELVGDKNSGLDHNI